MGESKPWEPTYSCAFAHESEATWATRRTSEQASGGGSGRRPASVYASFHFHAWDGYREKLLGTRHTELVAAEFRVLARPRCVPRNELATLW